MLPTYFPVCRQRPVMLPKVFHNGVRCRGAGTETKQTLKVLAGNQLKETLKVLHRRQAGNKQKRTLTLFPLPLASSTPRRSQRNATGDRKYWRCTSRTSRGCGPHTGTRNISPIAEEWRVRAATKQGRRNKNHYLAEDGRLPVVTLNFFQRGEKDAPFARSYAGRRECAPI